MHALYASVSASVTLPCARIGSVPPLPATIRWRAAHGSSRRKATVLEMDKWRSAIGWRGTRGPAPRRDASSDSAGGQATSALARMQRVGRCALEGEKGSGGGDLVGGTTPGYPAEGSR
ncbi:hypothetical protein PAHAL_3G198900 [Panicum hallii]|uniref:DUF834 domain-containing protein n=1 Tax=Panicum hallii TaxID=206008 RepID=A0A2T8KIR6_9POAL|nr:hypothetical protein PAHAL_3G198900 [Panicum hallii]